MFLRAKRRVIIAAENTACERPGRAAWGALPMPLS
jgi:hypothetical protein